MCPDCRFVFRVPRDHDGTGLVCPSCRRLLRIPVPGEATPPLLAAGGRPPEDTATPADADTAADPDRTSSRMKRKKHRSGGSRKSGTPSWDHDPKKSVRRSGKPEGWSVWRMGLLGGGLLVVLVAVVLVVMREPDPVAPPPPVAAPPPAADVEPAADDIPAVMRRSEFAFLAQAEPLVRAFLNARTVDELMPLVRNPEQVRSRILERNPAGTFDAAGITVFNPHGAVHYHNRQAAVDVLLGDHRQRQVALIETPEGLKVDWESFVGWSEMSWEEFLATKPSEPKVFRVVVRQVEYYNFDFADDLQWQSYRIESPDGQHQIFGYAERGSLISQQLRSQSSEEAVSATLALRFPQDKTARNQVVIDRYVMEGWVSEDDDDLTASD